MTDATADAATTALLAELAGVDPETITDYLLLVDDLGLDSIAILEVEEHLIAAGFGPWPGQLHLTGVTVGDLRGFLADWSPDRTVPNP